MSSARALLHGLVARTGVDLVRYSSVRHPIGRRLRMIRHHEVDLVIDVGANLGQFAQELRQHRYAGRIMSFEPLAKPFAALSEAASRDHLWDAVQFGIGDTDGPAQMNVAANSGASSSLLRSTSIHDKAAPGARFVGVEDVAIRRLDELVLADVARAKATYLKVDVQGGEQMVLDGATEVLPLVRIVQLELSLVPLFVGGPLFDDLIHVMDQRGFQLAGLEPGFTDPADGHLLQVDGLFLRVDAALPTPQAGPAGTGAA